MAKLEVKSLAMSNPSEIASYQSEQVIIIGSQAEGDKTAPLKETQGSQVPIFAANFTEWVGKRGFSDE
ncbi:hypothetical protein PG984_005730 [Apiospora sp. TS-2023a]